MRSTMASGMVLRSVAAPTPEAEASLTQRTPSTSTSTRLEPRWRRSACAEPAPTPLPSGGKPKLPLELNLVLSAEPEPVSACTTSPIEVRPLRSMSSRVMRCTGTRPSASEVLMRVPVTSTRSRVLICSPVSSCARATAGTSANSNAPRTARLRRELRMVFMTIPLVGVTGALPPMRWPTCSCKESVKTRQASHFLTLLAGLHKTGDSVQGARKMLSPTRARKAANTRRRAGPLSRWARRVPIGAASTEATAMPAAAGRYT